MSGSKPMSTGAVARLLQVDRTTVQGYCRRGELDHSTTPGGQYRVTPAQVDEFIRRKTAAAYRADSDSQAA